VVAPSLGPPDCQAADFTDIQAAINALPPAGGKIFVKAGTYVVSRTIRIKQSNVHIQGEGMGITNIVTADTMTASPAIQVYNPNAGNVLPLLTDTSKGETALTLSPTDAATLTPGDYVLLHSKKPVDAEDPQKHAGEVKQVVTVDALTGVITVDDQIYDAYLVADSAAVARITLLRNVTLSDFSVTTLAPFYTVNTGFTSFRFVENLQIERVESHHAYVSGIQLLSVFNSNISDCYIHHFATSNRRQTSTTGSRSAPLRKTSALRAAASLILRHARAAVVPWQMEYSEILSFRIALRWLRIRRTLTRTIPRRALAMWVAWPSAACQRCRKLSAFRCVPLIARSWDVRCCKQSAKVF